MKANSSDSELHALLVYMVHNLSLTIELAPYISKTDVNEILRKTGRSKIQYSEY